MSEQFYSFSSSVPFITHGGGGGGGEATGRLRDAEHDVFVEDQLDERRDAQLRTDIVLYYIIILYYIILYYIISHYNIKHLCACRGPA